mgnify:CR=1 FL=1
MPKRNRSEVAIPDERLQAIMDALARGARPTLSRYNDQYHLALGGRRTAVLLRMDGLTEEGKFVFDFLGTPIPTSLEIDQYQEPTQRGNAEYIKLKNGKEVKSRTLLPNGQMKNTRAGDVYYQIEQVNVATWSVSSRGSLSTVRFDEAAGMTGGSHPRKAGEFLKPPDRKSVV